MKSILSIATILIFGFATTANAETVFHSGDMIGTSVKNARGDSLGNVEDYVIDLRDGHIVYVAVAAGETLGFGGKLFAVPPQAIRLTEGPAFVMEANKEDFDRGRGFDANKWPTAA